MNGSTIGTSGRGPCNSTPVLVKKSRSTTMQRLPDDALAHCLTFVRWSNGWAACAAVCRRWCGVIADLWHEHVLYIGPRETAGWSVWELCAHVHDRIRPRHVVLRGDRSRVHLYNALNTLVHHRPAYAPLESLYVDDSGHRTEEILHQLAALTSRVLGALHVRFMHRAGDPLPPGPFECFVDAVVARPWDVLHLAVESIVDVEDDWKRLIRHAWACASELIVRVDAAPSPFVTLNAIALAPVPLRLTRLVLVLRGDDGVPVDIGSLCCMIQRAPPAVAA